MILIFDQLGSRFIFNRHFNVVLNAPATILFILVTMDNFIWYNLCRDIITELVYTKLENDIYILSIMKEE